MLHTMSDTRRPRSQSETHQLFTAHTQSKHCLSQYAGHIKDIPMRENDKKGEKDKSLWMYKKRPHYQINKAFSHGSAA